MWRVTFEDALTATTRWIAIDKSDTTNWPHIQTGSQLRIYGWYAWMRADGAEELAVSLYLLARVSATNGDIYAIDSDVLEVTAAGTDRTGYRALRDDKGLGLPMGVASNLPQQFMAFEDANEINDTNYQTDVQLITWEDVTTGENPAAGDIIAVVTERSGTAGFEFGMGIDYDEILTA